MKFQNVSLKAIECPWKKVIVPENIIGSSYCTHVVDPSCAFVSACSVLCHGTVSLLIQTMACHLSDAKPLPKQMLTYWQLDTKEQTSVKLVSKYIIFMQENVFGNVVCEISVLTFVYKFVWQGDPIDIPGCVVCS